MQYKIGRTPQFDNSLYCTNCGSKLHTTEVATKSKLSPRLLLPLIICIVCILWSLISVLFFPVWDLPAFGKYSSDADEIKIRFEYTEYELGIFKEQFRETRQNYSYEERIETLKMIDAVESFLDHPNLISCLLFFNEYKDFFESGKDASNNLRNQLLYATVIFVTAAVCLFFIVKNTISKKRLSLVLLISPILFCCYYGGIAAAIILVLSGLALYINQVTSQ